MDKDEVVQATVDFVQAAINKYNMKSASEFECPLMRDLACSVDDGINYYEPPELPEPKLKPLMTLIHEYIQDNLVTPDGARARGALHEFMQTIMRGKDLPLKTVDGDNDMLDWGISHTNPDWGKHSRWLTAEIKKLNSVLGAARYPEVMELARYYRWAV